MRELDEKGEDFVVEDIRMNSLFFADDSLILARTVESAREKIKIIAEISKHFGLHINEEKSKALIYGSRGHKEVAKEIEGIKVVKSLKYLGLEICDEEDIFRIQKEKIISEMRVLANATFYAIETSCDRVLMGKLWWKSLALPKVFLGLGVMSFTTDQVEAMQVIENTVFRQILRASCLTPNAVLRGEIGSSRMENRMIESRFLFVKTYG
ncbi:unnamed protein product, partial [Meganyctiphanes norvegica]